MTRGAALAARAVEELIRACAAGADPRYLFFWGHRPRPGGKLGPSCLSQWWPAHFQADGKKFSSAEQYMMWCKARLFGDERTASKIIQARTPAQAKALGREVNGFDEAAWAAHRWNIAVAGSVAKFSNDPGLREFLVGTRGCVLVEASPVDRIW